jgi:hypothetical protein
LLVAFAALSLWQASYHEPWRDEAHAWLIARYAPSLSALFATLGYEGTPGLWLLLLRGLCDLGLPYAAMFALHTLIILAAAAIFLRYAPFSTLLKGLCLFGYYLLFEYNVIARNYGISVLCLFLLAALYPLRFRRPWLYCGLLALLTQTNAHSDLLAASLGLWYCGELLFGPPARRRNAWIWVALGLPLLGLAAAAWQVRSPADLLPNLRDWQFTFQPEILHQSVMQAFVTLPPFRPDFWNVSLVRAEGLALPVWIGTCLFFARRPRVLGLYVLGSGLLLAFFMFKFSGYCRQHGFLYIWWIFCLWIAEGYPRLNLGGSSRRLAQWEGFLRWLLLLALLVQVVSAVPAVIFGARGVFSAGKPTAEFLLAAHLTGPDTLIASVNWMTGESYLPYLDGIGAPIYHVDKRDYFPYHMNGQISTEGTLTGRVAEAETKVQAGHWGVARIVFIAPHGTIHSPPLRSFVCTSGNSESFDLYISNRVSQ